MVIWNPNDRVQQMALWNRVAALQSTVEQQGKTLAALTMVVRALAEQRPELARMLEEVATDAAPSPSMPADQP